ncbi:hypothetical protein BDY21DRAFT_173010 [Lineolata rhizophorae]|uniref:CFEM domain-containing protein n=1 Tax=Lineolata rhizophorae TaxID=578093 RepID=A0A6A6NKZ7_9PEZI|nr:hypothetical protein BDY21DRAFT_173010 [Lineolata rhizophorae]
MLLNLSLCLTLLSLRVVTAHNTPQCWSDCVDSIHEYNCLTWDISCICRESDVEPLSALLACARRECASDEEVNISLLALNAACALLGDAIPSSVIRSAEVAATATRTSTRRSTGGHSTRTDDDGDRTSSDWADIVTGSLHTTVTRTDTDENGSTVMIVIPITIGPSGVVQGSPSTVAATTSIRTTAASTDSPAAAPASSSVASEPTATAAPSSSATITDSSSSDADADSESGEGSPFDNGGSAGLPAIYCLAIGMGLLLGINMM